MFRWDQKDIIEVTETHIAPTLSHPVRLQEYGPGIFHNAWTKSALKKALKKQYIRVNEQVATTATFIKGGETISLSIPDAPVSKKALIFPLEVLFEDEQLAVVHKPAGILVSGNSFKTIANALGQNLTPSTLSDATVPQPVHRLDYATTGALLTGKTSSGIRALNKLFVDGRIDKTYYAVAIGIMNKQGTIRSEIEGKAAQSDYRIIESVPSERFGQLNLVELKPKTGRRHQLRKHLASIGHPILGDATYGTEGQILKGQGLYLHAYSLEFIHPQTKENLIIQDDFPQRFKKVFSSLSRRN